MTRPFRFGVVAPVLTDVPAEEKSWLYLLRLVAFAIIILAIVFKNRRR